MLSVAVLIFISTLSLCAPFLVAWKPLGILAMFFSRCDHQNDSILPVLLFAVVTTTVVTIGDQYSFSRSLEFCFAYMSGLLIAQIHFSFSLLKFCPNFFLVVISSLVSSMRPFHSSSVPTIEIAASGTCMLFSP